MERLRADALKFSLSEAVVMASLRREALAIADTDPKRFHAWAGDLKAVDSEHWRWFLVSDSIAAYDMSRST